MALGLVKNKLGTVKRYKLGAFLLDAVSKLKMFVKKAPQK